MHAGFKKEGPDRTLFARLAILFALFFIMLIAVSATVLLIGKLNLSPRTEALSVAFAQNILVFILPVLIYARIFSHNPLKTLSLSHNINIRQVIGVVLAFLVGLPFLNQIIQWNESITFPSSMAGLENVLREMENQALKSTEILLATSSFGGLLSGVLIIGILTGFGEELFFRGGIQKTLRNCGIGHHWAIWVTATIFSALHFQFYGFIPRILLGAFFGYLLFWSDSIWVSALAHALNNSLVVITAWLSNRAILSFDVEKFGINEGGMPWMAIVSCILFFLLIRYGKRFFFEGSEFRFRPLKRNIK